MPTTPRYTYAEGRRQGIKEAIDSLTKTAQDFEEMAVIQDKLFKDLAKNRWLQAVTHRTKTMELEGKARLLRGQIEHLKELP